MEIGKIQKLRINNEVDFGVYLVDDDKNKVLLPKKQVPKGYEIGDEVEVFIYNDSKSRLIATTKKPFLTVGNVASLTVVDVNDVGAFLNIGLERDLLLPFSEQIKRVKVGDKVRVLMKVDKSNRLCATMWLTNKKIEGIVNDEEMKTMEYEYNANVVYKTIHEKFKGHLIYNDKTATSEQINNDFNMSKNTFKKAIGKLLKDDKLKITDKGIFLY